MNDFKILFEYIPRLAGGAQGQFAAERYPVRIDAYATHQYAIGTGVQQFLIADANADHRPYLHARYEERRPEGPFLKARAVPAEVRTMDAYTWDASTAFIFNAYATSYTKTGQCCWVPVGSAVVTMRALLELRPEGILEFGVWLNRDNAFPRDPRGKAATEAAHALMKGRLHILYAQLPASIASRMRTPTPYDIDASDEIGRRAAEDLCLAIDRGMQLFFSGRQHDRFTRVTKPFLRQFNVPEWRTARQPLPASIISLLEPHGEPDLAYFRRIFEVGLRRSGLNEAQAIELARSSVYFEQMAFASLVVRSLCVFPLSLCYMDDVLNRNVECEQGAYDPARVEPDEDFKVARLSGGDDCEGVALDVHMHFCQLRASNTRDPLLAAAAALLRQYTPTLMLGCVTNSKATAAALNQNCALAHTFSTWFPRSLFAKAASDPTPSLSTWDTAESALPVLIGEATAPMDPAMLPVVRYYNRQNVCDEALEAVRTRRQVCDAAYAELARAGADYAQIEVLGPPDSAGPGADYSGFYKYAVSMAASDLAVDRTLDWVLLHDGESKGVAFSDLLDARPGRVQMAPFVSLEEHEARLCDAVVADCQPVPNLTLAAEEFAPSAAITRALDSLVFGDPGAPGGTALHPRQTFLTARARDVDQRLIDALVQIRRLPLVRSLAYEWHTLCAPVDGSDILNAVLDVYIGF